MLLHTSTGTKITVTPNGSVHVVDNTGTVVLSTAGGSGRKLLNYGTTTEFAFSTYDWLASSGTGGRSQIRYTQLQC